MFEMLTGLPPFYAQDVQQMYFKIMHAKLEFPENMDSATKSILMGVCYFLVISFYNQAVSF